MDRWTARLLVGYQFERLDRTHIAPLIASIKRWHPDISVGVNSGNLREDCYQNRIYLGGGVKCVYQAVYAKLLVPPEEVLFPDPKNMTPKTRSLFELLFGGGPVAQP